MDKGMYWIAIKKLCRLYADTALFKYIQSYSADRLLLLYSISAVTICYEVITGSDEG